MAGPTQQLTRRVIIQPGEARTEYNPGALAHTVQNLELTSKGTLKSVVGPAVLRIGTRGYRASDDDTEITNIIRDGGSAYLKNQEYWNNGRPHSIFFAPLNGGSASLLLYRFGSRLYRFLGDTDTEATADEILVTGLSDSSRTDYPDVYVLIHNKVVWSNGMDTARVISFDGNVTELGYNEKPSPPDTLGPASVPVSEMVRFYPNTYGYSWPGRIGTPGDSLNGQTGAILSGSWYYYIQYEDIHGNLSPFSAASAPVTLASNQADPYYQGVTEEQPPHGAELSDLTRRFVVKTTGDAPSHTAAVHIYRTPDTLHVDQTPRLLARVPGSKAFVFGDNHADSDLGSQWERTVRVPTFRVACAHQGRLVIGNTPSRPGIVRRSEPGFAGTFQRKEFVFPDSGGAEVTAVVDHRGVLLAFTEKCVYSLANFSNPVPLTQGIGCVAPASVKALPNGMLVWLGRDGFYGMAELGIIQRLSAPIDSIMRRHINKTRMRRATAVVDPDTGEYRCALAPAGSVNNNLILCFDGKFWRRQRLGIHIAGMCGIDDWRQYTMAIGTDLEAELNVPTLVVPEATESSEVGRYDFSRVFVMNRQTTDYFAPTRSVKYRSGWLRFSEEGLTLANVRSMYVGMLDAWNGLATVRIYKNGSWNPVTEMENLRLIGVDQGSSIVTDIAGEAVIGTARARDPRLLWRELPVGLQNVSSWAFEIEIVGDPNPNSDNELGRMHLAAFAFDTSIATQGAPTGRVPRRADT